MYGARVGFKEWEKLVCKRDAACPLFALSLKNKKCYYIDNNRVFKSNEGIYIYF